MPVWIINRFLYQYCHWYTIIAMITGFVLYDTLLYEQDITIAIGQEPNKVQTMAADAVLSSFVRSPTAVISPMKDTWWRHQMGTFSALLALCVGNSPVPVNSPHKGQWRRALKFSLISAWINDRVNNREAGDMRRHRGHYDVNVMNRSLVWHKGVDHIWDIEDIK